MTVIGSGLGPNMYISCVEDPAASWELVIVSPTEATAGMGGTVFSAPGTYTFTVGEWDGVQSNALPMTVTAPVGLTLTGINPTISSKTQLPHDAPGARYRVHPRCRDPLDRQRDGRGHPLVTTFVSATELTTPVAADVAVENYAIVVHQASGTSTPTYTLQVTW